MQSKSYYGISVGAGGEFKGKDQSKLTLEVLLPFRNSAFREDYDKLKPLLQTKILPVTFSIGLNFALKKTKVSPKS